MLAPAVHVVHVSGCCAASLASNHRQPAASAHRAQPAANSPPLDAFPPHPNASTSSYSVSHCAVLPLQVASHLLRSSSRRSLAV
ncbi:hypothetical protein PF005_g24078 [Phytophthora fragariae]|uniref:Uncharacterized protein n=1 Tax=Phytophthora fragariae TaxID=53985 RepID=A0A6A3WQW2_9STRA|nr:hypothetical protein PF003_g9528 [Phytophthora fragariae]KAE8924892.1 hypothetical protein PF009_g24885 [Phytophthora fragariae]KAE9077629.1 hypothetical protein PF007_g24171 [Phytophthora fragariae]KAE9098197.1 hypothetical protein PF006_g23408 [Phytophthora fragariae]KAE9178445.1 hypothetical protein PF005_g24078 [Phytophthora fragariae]